MLISFAVTAKLICVFLFVYVKSWFSYDADHFSLNTLKSLPPCFRHRVYQCRTLSGWHKAAALIILSNFQWTRKIIRIAFYTIITHYVNVSVLIKFSQKTLSFFLHKIICCGCVLELPHRGDSNTYPQHMILWRNIETFHFLSF